MMKKFQDANVLPTSSNCLPFGKKKLGPPISNRSLNSNYDKW